ncbi:baseplate J/gp47 family protein, partial [bacterium]|nr:baseplate J/gp47 family protein [bacterium]
LKNQVQFKDFDYEGANMNVLLDILSYNTFYNSYYYNMAISEMFLDSASQRNSVISHAKELNYLPTSRRSARATATLAITYPNNPSNYFNIPEGTALIGRCGNKTYNLLTDISYSAIRSTDNENVFLADIEIYEGRKITETLTSRDTLLSNDNIDTRSIKLTVNGEEYTYRTDITGVSAIDKVFYLQAENDDKYSIQFGKDRFGVEPTITDSIIVSYRVTAGASANGITSLTLGAFGGASSIDIVVTAPSSGGRDAEDIESIRAFAPKSTQIQERAITRKDYETLLRSRFPNIQAISVYGGDEVDPPQFGKVIISVDVVGGEGVADYEIANFKRFLQDKTPLTIEPIFITAKFEFVDTSVTVTYDPQLTAKSPGQIQSEVNDALITYNNQYLNDFNKTLRQSRLAAYLDALDPSIVSTDIFTQPIIEYVPDLDVSASPSFSYEAALVQPYPFDEDNGFESFQPAISSTRFVVENNLVTCKDDGNGNMMLVVADGNTERVFKPSIGTVDYQKGQIRLIDLTISAFVGKAIKFTANTANKDIVPPKDRIIVIRGEDINVTVKSLES